MSRNIVVGDFEKAFLQTSVKEEDRDSFKFLFNVNGEEKHLRFTRVPFGRDASPFFWESFCSITLNSEDQNLKIQEGHSKRTLMLTILCKREMLMSSLCGSKTRALSYFRQLSFQFTSGNQMLNILKVKACQTLTRF